MPIKRPISATMERCSCLASKPFYPYDINILPLLLPTCRLPISQSEALVSYHLWLFGISSPTTLAHLLLPPSIPWTIHSICSHDILGPSPYILISPNPISLIPFYVITCITKPNFFNPTWMLTYLNLIPPLCYYLYPHPHSTPPFHFIVSKSPTPTPTLLSMLLFTASAAVQPICKPTPHTSPLCHMSWSATTTNCWSVCPKPDIIFPHHPTTPPLVLSSILDQYNLAPPTWGMRLESYWHLGWSQRWGCV